MEKLYAIGDIHGCRKALVNLLVKVAKDKGDDPATIVFLGDYIDRGPDSKGVIQTLIDLQTFGQRDGSKTKYVFLRGNHEVMMLTERVIRFSGMWTNNGGIQTMNSYDLPDGTEDEETFQRHFKWIEDNTVLLHQQDGYVFVHAGIDPFKPLDEQNPDHMVWARHWDKYDGDYFGGHFVVRGHTPVEKPVYLRNQLNIDTGCVFGKEYSKEYGFLTAAVLHEGKDKIRFIQSREFD
jgi:serine/threonine protein phosphatase 1